MSLRSQRRTPSAGSRRWSRLVAIAALCAGIATGPASVASERSGARPTERPRLRVLVQLDLPTVPEGRLRGRRAVDRQRLEILWGQSLVVSDMADRDFRVVRRFDALPFLVAELSVDEMSALVASPWVRSLSGDDPLRPSLADSTRIVEATSVWPSGFDGRGWTVAVLDTGVDGAHPHLAGKVVEEACFSSAGSCPDGSVRQVGPGAGVPCDYSDGCIHGTHVAGIAAGSGPRLRGIAPGATIASIQVFSRFDGAPWCGDAESCPLAYTSDLLAALEHVYALRSRLQVASVNMSLGGGYYNSQLECDTFNPATKSAIDTLRSVGIATIVASGNEGYLDGLGSPSCISSAVSVGSTTKQGDVSFFSNTARFLDLLAPGSSIVSSIPGGGYAALSGTSMAAPHVAGAWAILREADPLADVDTILERLERTGLPVDDPAADVTKRLVQLRGAVEASSSEAEHDVEIRNLNRPRRLRAGKRVSVRWKASPSIASFDVSFTLDGGATWLPIAEDLGAGAREATWRVPRLGERAREVRVRVEGFDSRGEKVASDRNDRWLVVRADPDAPSP